jgi:hypothetical protein
MIQVASGYTEVSNAAETTIDTMRPYCAEVTIKGVSPILFHRMPVEAYEAKAGAARGSKAKKTDDVESYVYRDPTTREIQIPGEYVRQSIIKAAKYAQDPRSPRKSAMDLVRATVMCLTPYAGLGTSQWDFLDRRRAVIQRAAIVRTRPGMAEGWEAEFVFMVNRPDYVSPTFLNGLIASAGQLEGIGDFRPTFGRFQVTKFKVLTTTG